MPIVSRFYGIVITMYYDDRHQPHFHARYAEYQASFSVEPPALYVGAMPRRQQNLILAWAELHQKELLANWQRARDGLLMQDIEGLQ